MKNKDLTIWFDFTNVPHVNFLRPIINHFNNYRHIYSIRDFAETKGLFEKQIGKEYFLVGEHKGQSKLRKVVGSFGRIIALQKQIPYFDVKVSVGGDSSSIVAKLRGKKSITFDDNEKSPNWRYSRFSDLAFWPDSIDLDVLKKQGFKPNKLFQYSGFKEDLYLADYEPDLSFSNQLPFNEYVVVRPENIQANYVGGNTNSIVPELLKELSAINENILFLPRYSNDYQLARGYKNVYIPEKPINGLDACYFSKGVFTGAGTIAREAACIGVPAFSFYAGKELLTVDKVMVERGWLTYSRNPSVLLQAFQKAKRSETNHGRSRVVKQQIIDRLNQFFSEKCTTGN